MTFDIAIAGGGMVGASLAVALEGLGARTALIEAVLAFALMAQALGSRLEEAEINPLFVLPHGVLAADGLVVLA